MEVATAAPGGPFVEAQRVGTAVRTDPTAPALAVAPGGRALLAFTEHGGVRVLERHPGAPGFVPVAHFTAAAATSPATALRSDGAAVVAWRTSYDVGGGVAAGLRLAGGAFAPALRVASDLPRNIGLSTDYARRRPGNRPRPPFDARNARLGAALAPDGRLLLGWTVPRAVAAAVTAMPIAATGTLAAGFGSPQALGSPARSANGVAPIVLPDGSPALAWTDNVPDARMPGSIPEFPAGGGRLHIAPVGSATPGPAPPRLAVRPLPSTRWALRIAVRCSAACDVRATVPTGAAPGVVGGGAAASLRRAGRRVLRLRGLPGEPVTWRGRRVRVHVLATAPGGARGRVVRRPLQFAGR
jgi:hypothetical protein